MTTVLEKTLKRQLSIGGRAYILTVSAEGLKLTLKGRRKGLELRWDSLVSGDAALAVALNASLRRLAAEPAAHKPPSQPGEGSKGRISSAQPKNSGRVRQSTTRRSKA